MMVSLITDHARDLAIPQHCRVGHLLATLSEIDAHDWNSCLIRVGRTGAILGSNDTLDHHNLSDGDCLYLLQEQL